MSAEPTNDADNLERAVVRFCRCARANGLGSGRTTLECLEVLRIVQTEGAAAIEDALRAVLCSSKSDWDLFAKLFALVWRGRRQPSHRQKSRVRTGSPVRDSAVGTTC